MRSKLMAAKARSTRSRRSDTGIGVFVGVAVVRDGAAGGWLAAGTEDGGAVDGRTVAVGGAADVG